MKDLNYELKKLCHRHRDGSYATQHARERILTLVPNQLVEMGFKDMKATSLKPKEGGIPGRGHDQGAHVGAAVVGR